MTLNETLNKQIREYYKVNKIKHPILYNFPIGLRYEIGTGKVYDEEGNADERYIKTALKRVEDIFEDMKFSDDILVVLDRFIDDDELSNDVKVVQIIRGVFKEIIDEEIGCLSEINEDGESINFDRHFFHCTLSNINYLKLFEAIIKADIGGFSELVSSVFIFDLEKHMMLHLYDDRGLDVVAENTSLLLPIYKKYNKWILSYDRVKIDTLFNNNQCLNITKE